MRILSRKPGCSRRSPPRAPPRWRMRELLAVTRRREAELAAKSVVLEATLQNMGQGLAAFDADLRLTAWNTRLFDLLGFPLDLLYVGCPFTVLVRDIAERGEYGPGDPEELAAEHVALARRVGLSGASASVPTESSSRWRSTRYAEAASS